MKWWNVWTGNNTYLFGQCYGHDNVKVLLPGDVHFRPWQKINLPSMTASAWSLMRNDLRISADIRRRTPTKPEKHIAVICAAYAATECSGTSARHSPSFILLHPESSLLSRHRRLL